MFPLPSHQYEVLTVDDNLTGWEKKAAPTTCNANPAVIEVVPIPTAFLNNAWFVVLIIKALVPTPDCKIKLLALLITTSFITEFVE